VQQAKIQRTSQKIVQFGHVVSEMCERTDIQTRLLQLWSEGTHPTDRST